MDDEYFWEPVPGWSLRRRGERARHASDGYLQAGSGDFVIDFAFPPPEPEPVTSIAWRLGHRVASHFGGAPVDYHTYDYPGTAGEALTRLDALHDEWVSGVRSWSDDDLQLTVGALEPGFEAESRATLVLHIHRELIHHGAEVALLRDLWAAR